MKVSEMKSSWDAQQQQLTAGRDAAVAAADAAAAKLRECDDAFRRQLDVMETTHRAVLADKQTEIDAAVQRTGQVEDEMRLLLRETEQSRQTMEARLSKLTAAFTDLQQDLTR